MKIFKAESCLNEPNAEIAFPLVKELENHFQMEPSKETRLNISMGELEIAGDMFLYILSCPSILKAWISFYSDLFQNHSPSHMILNLNRILKGNTQENKSMQAIAGALLKRMNDYLPLKYDEIQNMFKMIGNSSWSEESILSIK